MSRLTQGHAHGGTGYIEAPQTEDGLMRTTRASLFLCGKRPSSWSRSTAKRMFDCSCVLLALPVLLPVLLVVAFAVWISSNGPIFFLQERVGRLGCRFTIIKFRTMIHAARNMHRAVTTTSNQRFTSIGPFLRRWKLDELPQLLNVLWGDMSLVGPRPKMPEHMVSDLACRPGITGAATIAFAREEAILDAVPTHKLESFFHAVVLPTKRRLDEDYMAEATFFSDFRLIAKSILRHWDSSIVEEMLKDTSFETGDAEKHHRTAASPAAHKAGPVSSHQHAPVATDAAVPVAELAIS